MIRWTEYTVVFNIFSLRKSTISSSSSRLAYFAASWDQTLKTLFELARRAASNSFKGSKVESDEKEDGTEDDERDAVEKLRAPILSKEGVLDILRFFDGGGPRDCCLYGCCIGGEAEGVIIVKRAWGFEDKCAGVGDRSFSETLLFIVADGNKTAFAFLLCSNATTRLTMYATRMGVWEKW